MGLTRWFISNFPALGTQYTLVEAQPDEETVIFSLLLSNYSATDAAEIEVEHTDTDGTTPIFQWILTKDSGESPTAIQAPIVLNPGDKMLFVSNNPDVSILASGEVKVI
jgi:hypothetical protein